MILASPARAGEAIEELFFIGDGVLTSSKKTLATGQVDAKFADNALEDDRWPPSRWITGRIDCTNAVEKWRKVATASTISGGIVSLQSCSQ
jgi:hypothetical protein